MPTDQNAQDLPSNMTPGQTSAFGSKKAYTQKGGYGENEPDFENDSPMHMKSMGATAADKRDSERGKLD